MPAQQTVAPATTEPAKAIAHRGHAPDQEYYMACPACRSADKARSSIDNRTLDGKDLDLYTFIVPDNDGCAAICREYLYRKYPDAPWISSALDLAKLGGWQEGDHIIVVRRDCWPRQHLMPQVRRMKDAEDKFESLPVPLDELIVEVVESAPIHVRSCMAETRADRFTKSQLNYRTLIKKLSEVMCQPYRIDLPKDPRDTVLRMIWQ